MGELKDLESIRLNEGEGDESNRQNHAYAFRGWARERESLQVAEININRLALSRTGNKTWISKFRNMQVARYWTGEKNVENNAHRPQVDCKAVAATLPAIADDLWGNVPVKQKLQAKRERWR